MQYLRLSPNENRAQTERQQKMKHLLKLSDLTKEELYSILVLADEIFEEAENRLHAQKAVMVKLMA